MLRSLRFHWRLSLALVLGAATASAVLTGALVVGDSVRGSLKQLALGRLGRVDRAIVSPGYFSETLAPAIVSGTGGTAASVILLRGTAVQPDSRARAAGIQIIGAPETFAPLFGRDGEALSSLHPGAPGGPLPRVVLNRALAQSLQAAAGDPILLRMARPQDAPPDTLLGRRDEESLVASLRGSIAAVIEDDGPGAFTLTAHQSVPLNAFVPLADLQRALARAGQVNALLVSEGDPARPIDWDSRVRGASSLEDLSLELKVADGYLAVESRRLVLSPEIAEHVAGRGRALAAATQPVQTYLATAIRAGSRTVPYSTVSALDPAGDPADRSLPWLTLSDGGPAPPLTGDAIYLNAWAAGQLGAATGERIELDYFVVGEDESLLTRTATFTLTGIVRMEGLATDRRLTPDYPGIEGARDIASWNPPFPVELSRIRAADEAYWDDWGAAPKAFIAPGTAAALWTNRYGTHTSIRMAPPQGAQLSDLEARLRRDLVASLPLAPLGLAFRPVREEALAAGSGATDFSGLFLGFSLFLIVSAVLLCSLLMLLSVETRAREIGLLLSVGWPQRRVKRRFLAEGMTLASAGAAVGLAGGILYAWLLLLGLRTLWQPAVGTRALELHIGAWSLPAAAGVSLLVLAGSIAAALRRLGRAEAASLLAGSWPRRGTRPGRPIAFGLTLAATLLSLALTVAAFRPESTAPAALAFGAGSLLLVGALGLYALRLRSAGKGPGIAASSSRLVAMAARNSAWNPARAMLSVALMASAAFVLLTVAASRRSEKNDSGRHGGSGGYELVARSEIPLFQDLSSSEGRSELGLGAELETLLAASAITSFRSVPGDDVSCLNLYRATRPRLLGVPGSQIERGGFQFAATIRSTGNPWTLLEEPLEPGVVAAFGDQNSVLWILHSGLGGEIELHDEAGRPLRLRFVGLLQGSLFQSEVLISERALLKHFPGRAGRDWFLIDTPPGQAARASRGLEEALASRGFDAEEATARIAAFHAVENTYLSTFLLVGGLGLLLGTAGLGISVARNVMERRGELAGMRAFGWPKQALARLILLENAVLLAVGLGAGALAAALAVSPRLVAGQVRPPLAPILTILALVSITGLLAGALAARGALRAPLIPSLREER